MSRSVQVFSQQYIKICFDTWYLNGRPTTAHTLELIPVDDNGKRPSYITLNRWRTDGAWDEWADSLDARALEKSDELLIRKKVALLKKNQENASKLAAKALEHLLKQGFDSSSAAVNAYFKSTEEERKIEGFSDLLERLDKMRNEELTGEIMTLLQRASDNEQVIDAEGVPELEDGKE